MLNLLLNVISRIFCTHLVFVRILGLNEHLYQCLKKKSFQKTLYSFLGIVRFDINYTVTGANIESSMGYIEVQETLREASLLNISWEDGDKLDISVKATDIIGKYTEDKITIYKDTSYPAIENLWLSYGNKSELFVHRQLDLTSMT